ncbi:hypothetical protein [Azospirillum argentinense]
MNCDWIFLDKDGTRTGVTLQEPTLPVVGNGKSYNQKNYRVVLVGTNRVISANPLVIGEEI